MNAPDFTALRVGDEIPGFETPALTRHALALFAGASGDYNPVHVDIDFARAAGLDDVIGHGMLTMAWLGRVLTDWVPQPCIRRFSARFLAPTRIGDRLRCSGRIAGMGGGAVPVVTVELQAVRRDGEPVATGKAEILWGRGTPRMPEP